MWRCYGLYSALKTNTGLFNRIDEIPLYFDTQVRQLKHTHLYETCSECDHLDSGLCGGGCFVFRVAGMKTQPFPLNDDDWLMDAVPVREPFVSLWKNRQGEEVSAIPFNTPAGRTLIHFQDGDNPVSFYEILGVCDGSYRVKDLVERWVNRFETADSARQFILFAMRLFFARKAVDLKSG